MERLPNELLGEIFRYLTVEQLHTTFYNLNRRLKSIVDNSLQLSWIFPEDWDRQKRWQPPFSLLLHKLIVQHDEPIDLKDFTNLRSLTLIRPTEEQCNAIRPESLPYLQNLTIRNEFFFDYSDRLCRLVFSSAFPRLKTLRIDRLTLSDLSWQSHSHLQHLTVSPSLWKRNWFDRIFIACPNLVSLNVRRIRNDTFLPSDRTFYSHALIRRLSVHFSSVNDQWIEQLAVLLRVMPFLQSLALHIDHCNVSMNIPLEELANTLSQWTKHLISFQGQFPLTKLLTTNIEQVCRLHPLFLCVEFGKYSQRNVCDRLIVSSDSRG
jgi:hypothetical protein